MSKQSALKFLNQSICPLCKKSNQCEAEKEKCWCFDIEIPLIFIEFLKELKVSESCVCFECIKEYKKNPDSFILKHSRQ
jgi:hypothetical protein